MTLPAPTEWSYETTREVVLGKIARNKREERVEILGLVSAGKPFAQPGSRDATLQRVASWLAFYCCDGDPEAITDVLLPSLEAMEEESPADFISYEDALSKVVRAQNDARAKELAKREAEGRMASGIARMATARAAERATILSVPSPTIGAAPVAIPAGGNVASFLKILGGAAGIGSNPKGSALADVPGQQSPGRAAKRPFPWEVKRGG